MSEAKADGAVGAATAETHNRQICGCLHINIKYVQLIDVQFIDFQVNVYYGYQKIVSKATVSKRQQARVHR